MEIHLNRIVLIFLAASFGGCATPLLQVTSSPENAEVSVISKEKEVLKLGKTPITINRQNFPQLFSTNFQLQVTKEGYVPQSILVPKLSQLGAEGAVNFNMEEQALNKLHQSQDQSNNELARGIAEISNLMQSRKLLEAQTLAQSLTAKFDSVSVLYDIQGNIFFLQKNFDRALDSYKKANKLDPANAATIRMIKRIEQLQGLGT